VRPPQRLTAACSPLSRAAPPSPRSSAADEPRSLAAQVSSAIAFPRHLPLRRCHVSRIVSAVERFPLGTVISSVEKIGQLVLVASSRSQSNVRRRRRRRQNYRTAAASLQNDLDGLRIFTDH